MAGQRDRVRRDWARLPAQSRGDMSGRVVEGFLEGLVGGLLLGAALGLIVARRGAVVGDAPIRETSIELKGLATRLAQDAREGAGNLANQADTLSNQAKAALDRRVPGDTRPGE